MRYSFIDPISSKIVLHFYFMENKTKADNTEILKEEIDLKISKLENDNEKLKNENEKIISKNIQLETKNNEIISQNKKLLARLEKLENIAFKLKNNEGLKLSRGIHE